MMKLECKGAWSGGAIIKMVRGKHARHARVAVDSLRFEQLEARRVVSCGDGRAQTWYCVVVALWKAILRSTRARGRVSLCALLCSVSSVAPSRRAFLRYIRCRATRKLLHTVFQQTCTPGGEREGKKGNNLGTRMMIHRITSHEY